MKHLICHYYFYRDGLETAYLEVGHEGNVNTIIENNRALQSMS